MQTTTTASGTHKPPVDHKTVEEVLRHFIEGGGLVVRVHHEAVCMNCESTLNPNWCFHGVTMDDNQLQFFVVPPGQEKPYRYRVEHGDRTNFLTWARSMSDLLASGKAPDQGSVPSSILLRAGVSEITKTKH